MSRSRVYAEVNNERPKEYWDYESLKVTWGCVHPLPRPHARARPRSPATPR